jgi:hypothetical protein
VPLATVGAAIENEKLSMYEKFGRACLADFCDDWVVYRNLEPLDKRVPGLKQAFYDMELRSEQIPRKQERDYAKAAVWFVNRIQQVRGVSSPVNELLFLGDTLFNDGQAFSNMISVGRWRGACFIGAERLDQEPTTRIEQETIFIANRWPALVDWLRMIKEQGFQLAANTAVIIDIDKTALGAKGRNDKVIDRARLAGIYRTMDSVLGEDFDQALFEKHYNELNRSRYHLLTADNQDYLVYICMVLNTRIMSLDELISEVDSKSLDNFEQFIRWVNSRMMINPSAGIALREVHEAVNSSVRIGDPTPFKRFRRQEFVSTLEHMGNMPDNSSVTELLENEITITEEVYQLAMWLKGRGCQILCLSDKPDEASLPHPRTSPELPPLHRALTHRVGADIREELRNA